MTTDTSSDVSAILCLYSMINHTVYLGLGTNLGDKEQNISKAVSMIADRVGEVKRCSSLLISSPWGFESANEFLNSVVCVSTNLMPEALLDVTQQIEKEIGRTQKTIDGEYHDRIIDIDILLYDDVEFRTSRLVIPHPLMSERAFVMNPLKEIMSEAEYARVAERLCKS